MAQGQHVKPQNFDMIRVAGESSRMMNRSKVSERVRETPVQGTHDRDAADSIWEGQAQQSPTERRSTLTTD